MLKKCALQRKNMYLVVKNEYLFAHLQSQMKLAYLT